MLLFKVLFSAHIILPKKKKRKDWHSVCVTKCATLLNKLSIKNCEICFVFKGVRQVFMDLTVRCNVQKVLMDWTVNTFVAVRLKTAIMCSVVSNVRLHL